MTKIPFKLTAALFAATAIIITGCGKKEESPSADTADDGVRSVRITSNDQMRFSLSEIKASPGEEIRLTHANIGRMPKETMGHNWVLFKPMSEGDLNRLAMSAASNPPDYLPADQSAILVQGKMLGPGETDVITFTAPEEPGSNPFLCTFPGHATLMRGFLIVE